MNKKYTILALILISLMVGTIVSASWWRDLFTSKQINKNLGTTTFPSSQVGQSPQNGYYLKTNGTVSTWASVSATGGGSSGIGWASSTQDLLIYNTDGKDTNPYTVLIQNNGTTATTTAGKIFEVIGNSEFDQASTTLLSANYASSTLGYFGYAYLSNLATPAGAFLAVNASGLIIATTSPSGSSYTNFGTDFFNYFSATTTDYLTQGATNKYWSNLLWASQLAGTTTDALAQGATNLYNQTHTGEVTGATALTVADNIIDEANLKMSTNPTNLYFLVASSSASGGMDWIASSSVLLGLGTGGGASTFLTLTDTPSDYAADGGKMLMVNYAENAVEFTATSTLLLAGDVSGTLGVTIVGDDSHNHTASTISGLSVADFTSANISQWTNDTSFIASTSLIGIYPLAFNSATGKITSATSSATSAGVLSPADWTLFNNKVGSSSIDSLAELNALLSGEDVASTTWTGATSLITLGSITTGSWHGTLIDTDHGGTGLGAGGLAAGYIPYGAGTSAFATSTGLYYSGTNLGVGTSSPGARLHVDGNAGAGYVRIVGSDDGDNYSGFELWNDAWTRKWQFILKSIAGQTGDFNISHYNGSSWSAPFVIAQNNNVGIGTSTPGTLLSLGDTSNYINFSEAATSTFSKGINLKSGCFAINGTCVGGSSYTTFNNDFDVRLTATSSLPKITTLAGLSITKSQISDLGILFTQAIASTTFVDKNDWTTIDNYPAACGAGQFTTAIGDSLTCSTPAGGGGGGLFIDSASAPIGGIPYFNTTSTSTALATSTIFIGTNSRVGIGTTTPNSLFGVNELIDFDNTDFNTKIGYQAGINLKIGAQYNTYLGYETGISSSTSKFDTAANNTAIGYQAEYSNTSGHDNVAIGYQALYSDTTGYSDIAIGYQSMYLNKTGSGNVAMGYQTLYSNTTGYANAAIGNYALYQNTTGYLNTGIGNAAFENNTTGNNNTGLGAEALQANTTGTYNTAVGVDSLQVNRLGIRNTAVGFDSLNFTEGSGNTSIGYLSGKYNETGNYNTFLGYDTGSTSPINLNYTTTIGAGANVETSNSLILGGIAGSDYAVNVGIGTTSPYATLSVVGRGVFDQDIRADYYTATSTSLASTFPYASSTAFSTIYASSTSYYGGELTDCTGKLLWASGKFSCSSDNTGTGGAGTVATSSSPTQGQLAYWTSKDAWPETLGSVATNTLTATYPISISNAPNIIGSAGAVITFPATSTLYGTGLAGQVLMWSGSVPTWTATTSLINPMSATGDLIIGGTAGAATRLGIGTGGYILAVSSGNPAWLATSSFIMADEIDTFSELDAIVADGDLAILGSAMTGTFDGVDFGNGTLAQNALWVGGAAAIPSELAVGTGGNVLGVVNGVPAWLATSSLLSRLDWFATTTIPHITTALNLTNASTTGLTITSYLLNSAASSTFSGLLNIGTASSSNVRINGYPISEYQSIPFDVSTTTAWAGTSTLKSFGTAIKNETWVGAYCFTLGGTLMAYFGNGTASTTIMASSSNAYVNFTDINITAGQKRFYQCGTPASSPTYCNCTLKKFYTP